MRPDSPFLTAAQVASLAASEALIIDPPACDVAIIGTFESARGAVAIYDLEALVIALAEAWGWPWEDAIDWISYNTLGSLRGSEREPIVV